MFSAFKVERVVFGLILGISLLMFFQPLVRLHGPNGTQVSDVLTVRSELSQLQSNLRILATIDSAAIASTTGGPVTAKPLTMPFSLRMASQVHWFVFASLGLCVLALLANFSFKKGVGVFSLLGGCAAAIAVLHVMLMGTDLESWTGVIMNTVSINSTKDPSRVIMTANSFLISPGIALYVLPVCLFLVSLLSFTGALPRLSSVVRHERRVSESQPICLRPVNSRYPADNCTSLDGSTKGLLLESSLNHYYMGMEVYFTRKSSSEGPANREEHGSVVRVEKMQNGKCRVGIHIISEA